MWNTSIEIRDLSFEIGGRRLLHDLNLKASSGVVYGLFGPNGSGKTTLFNLLCGLHKPTSGRILLYGEEVRKYDPYYVSTLKAGLVRTFQVPTIINDLSVLDNLLLAYRFPHEGFSTLFYRSGLDRQKDASARQQVLNVLERFNLASKASNMASLLSYGERRLVGNLRAILTDAKIVLLDEPFANLNVRHITTLKTLLRSSANEDGRTIMLIEHLPDNLLNLVDVLLRLHERKLESHPIGARGVDELTAILRGSVFQYD